MSVDPIHFAQLRQLLLDLGFQEGTIEGKHIGFLHPESDTFFTFRMYRPLDVVSQTDAFGVRRQLDWRGLLSEETFDATMRKASA